MPPAANVRMNHSQTASATSEVTPYLQEIENVAQRGHKDLSTENLLIALVEIHRQQPAVLEEFVSAVLARAAQKPIEITPRAFRLSLLTTIKLYLRVRRIKDYEFFSVDSWKQVVLKCLTAVDDDFLRSCLRDVSTVKIYRYLALQLLGGILDHSRVMSPEGLSILDGGCSINIGVKCLNNLDIFHPIEVAPDILDLFGGKLPYFVLGHALGIDKYPPNLERTLASLFPSEVKRWEDIYTRLYYLEKPKVSYRQQDILFLEQQPDYHERFDVVFLSSLLRRLTPHQIADVLRQVNYATNSHGVVVINEQMSEETIEGGGNYATFILPKLALERVIRQTRQEIKLYALLNMASQVFVYPDENCRKVLAGNDFYDAVREYSSLAVG